MERLLLSKDRLSDNVYVKRNQIKERLSQLRQSLYNQKHLGMAYYRHDHIVYSITKYKAMLKDCNEIIFRMEQGIFYFSS